MSPLLRVNASATAAIAGSGASSAMKRWQSLVARWRAVRGVSVTCTGVAIALPEGFAGFVHPRSGLAARAGLSVVNAPGTIDSGYRGEIKVCLINHDRAETLSLRRGDRIAQLVVQRVECAVFEEVEALPESQRGTGGHGSTGGHEVLTGPASAGSEHRTEV